MAAGILRIQSFEARQSAPAAGVTVTITGQGFSASRLTDDTGNTQDLESDAPVVPPDPHEIQEEQEE